ADGRSFRGCFSGISFCLGFFFPFCLLGSSRWGLMGCPPVGGRSLLFNPLHYREEQSGRPHSPSPPLARRPPPSSAHARRRATSLSRASVARRKRNALFFLFTVRDSRAVPSHAIPSSASGSRNANRRRACMVVACMVVSPHQAR